MTILRGALWERVSTEEQAKHGYSIQTQVEALEEYAGKSRIKIVDHYCDEGVSAGKPYRQRPEMMRLLKDVNDGKIDIIIFTRLDRWFRNVKEYFKVQEILEDNRVEWKAIWEDYDTTTPNGRMAITIFLAIAQAEREKGAERIREVFHNKRKNRESFFGPNSTPIGYMEVPDEDGIMRLVKDPDIEDAMQAFWDIAVKYENVDKAARTITLEYGLTRSRKKWYELVKKEIYTGTYKGVTEYCPAYVSREDWIRLQNRGSIKKTQHDRIYLFAGLIRCPLCGKKLSSKYCKQTRKSGKEKEYFSYRCPDKEIRLCANKHSISQIKTETWLLENLRRLLKDEIAWVEIERKKPKPKPKTNINALKEALRRLEVVYMAGNKSDDEYLREQKELKAAIKKAEAGVTTSRADRDITHLKQTLEMDFISIYETLDDHEKRRFWRSLIEEIKIDGTEVVSVTFS
ncbi:MAG: recombinase family protein [Bacteroidales bacterium]|nr:recombinase family protein [Bacteroidales bacterium]